MPKSRVRICPSCGKEYSDHPAVSRKDNKTLVCPTCGLIEALEEAGILDGLIKAIIEDMKNETAKEPCE